MFNIKRLYFFGVVVLSFFTGSLMANMNGEVDQDSKKDNIQQKSSARQNARDTRQEEKDRRQAERNKKQVERNKKQAERNQKQKTTG